MKILKLTDLFDKRKKDNEQKLKIKELEKQNVELLLAVAELYEKQVQMQDKLNKE
ncbi:hypothetical protein PV797_05385 [Clostridiaceae bacterium M8S5]|nr:hypothetical protein PV797_05385 [Clostridiaceae bacterium M8S5]